MSCPIQETNSFLTVEPQLTQTPRPSFSQFAQFSQIRVPALFLAPPKTMASELPEGLLQPWLSTRFPDPPPKKPSRQGPRPSDLKVLFASHSKCVLLTRIDSQSSKAPTASQSWKG